MSDPQTPMAGAAGACDPAIGEGLAFWFGAPDAADRGRARDEWFEKHDAFDAAIAARFGTLVDDAIAGARDHWTLVPEGALAYVVLLDQFTRNAYRGTPKAFAGDARALACARRIVARGWDLREPPVHRWFCYLPFEHSESLRDQQRSLELFSSLRDDPASASSIDYARRHLEVVQRFGRFPHRNAILGRASTAEELAFLAQPGSGF